MENKEKPKYQDAVLAYSNATLGISIVVAVLIGVGIGYGLEKLFGCGGSSDLYYIRKKNGSI